MLRNTSAVVRRPGWSKKTLQIDAPRVSNSGDVFIQKLAPGNHERNPKSIRRNLSYSTAPQLDSNEGERVLERIGGAGAETRRAGSNQVHEKSPLESRYDSLFVAETSSSSEDLSIYDWRARSASRNQFRRSPLNTALASAKKPKPRAQREKAITPNVSPDAPFFDKAIAYREKYAGLLDAEKEEADALVKLRLQSWPVERLEAEGFCMRNLRAFWLDATSFGQPVAAFSIGAGYELPRNVFKVGDVVFVSRNGPLEQTSKVYGGQVTVMASTYIAVAFHSREELSGLWRLDLGSSDIMTKRMKEAMSSFLFNPELQREGTENTTIVRGTHLREILLQNFRNTALMDDQDAATSPIAADVPALGVENRRPSGAFIDDMRIQSWCARYSKPDPIVMDGDPFLDHLNVVQKRAIAMMLSEKLSLVQGPPGTGKTKTIVEAIRLLKAHFAVPFPILVCTYTNVAVDNLVEGLAATPSSRGFSGHRNNGLYQHNFLAKVEQHPLKAELDKLQNQIDKLQDMLIASRTRLERLKADLAMAYSVRKDAVEQRDRLEVDMKKLNTQKTVKQSMYFGLYRQMTYDICHEADVICTTCIASACFALTVIDFPVVFLDEASMSTEPATLIPIMKGSKHIALVGDHKQLPPVVVSKKAKEGGLTVSLFERMMAENTVPSLMLDIQYRMHPKISRFPSSEFYDFNLLDGTVDRSGKVAPALLPPNSKHLVTNPETGNRPSVIFLNHTMPECSRNRSRANDGEAMLTIGIIEDLLRDNPGMKGSDIGVISPYVAQTVGLRSLLSSDMEVFASLKSTLGAERAREVRTIEVKTVDGFEGREKEVIIFSTVRNNDEGHIGFLADRRRLNVGLTRAKRALFVLGNSHTLGSAKIPEEWQDSLSKNPEVGEGTWKHYLQWLASEKLIILLHGPKLRDAMFTRTSRASLL